MPNNKGRPDSSGTTSQKRRLDRESKQWTSLAKADPPVFDSEGLKDKVEALKKAQESAEKQLQQALQEEEALKKAQGDRPIGAKKGKLGPRSSSAAPKPKLVTADEALKKSEMLKDKLAALKKEQAAAASSSSKPLKKEQEKEAWVEVTRKSLKKDKSVVIVDWHNTLEKGNKISAENMEALNHLVLVTDVVIISWVGSAKREASTLQQMQALPEWTLKKVKDYLTTRTLTGSGGKIDLGSQQGGTVAFDDSPDVLWEAAEWGITPYPIKGKQSHMWPSYTSFHQACWAYLKKYYPEALKMQLPPEANCKEVELPVTM